MKRFLLGLLLVSCLHATSQTFTYTHGVIYKMNPKTVDSPNIVIARDFVDSSTFHDIIRIVIDTAKNDISFRTALKTTTFRMISMRIDSNVITVNAVKSDDETGNIALGVFSIDLEYSVAGFYYDNKTFIFLIGE